MGATIVARSNLRSSKAITTTVRNLAGAGVVRIFENVVVSAISKRRGMIELTLCSGVVLEASTIFLMFGYKPRAEEALRFQALHSLAIDSNGIIKVDSNCQTSIRGVYAIGDVANSKDRCVIMAMAMGSVAARKINLVQSE